MARSGRFAALRERSRRGFRGYPVATVAYYGPDDSRATKAAVGVILAEGAEPSALERWHSAKADVRFDQDVCGAALDFMAAHHVKTVVHTGADRDRWTGEVIR